MTGTPTLLTDLLAECDALGIRLLPAGDGVLTIDALTLALLARLKAHKADVLESIERFEERAAIMEFYGGSRRPETERQAKRECFTN